MAKTALLGPIRLSPQEGDAAKAAAEATHQKTAEFARMAITAFSDITPRNRERLQTLADSLHLRIGMLLDMLLEASFATADARQDVYADMPPEPEPWLVVLNGELASGDNLRQFLLRHYLREFESAREQDILYERDVHGIAPTAEEAQFLVERGPRTKALLAAEAQVIHRQEREQWLRAIREAGFDLSGIPSHRQAGLIELFKMFQAGTVDESTFRAQVETVQRQNKK